MVSKDKIKCKKGNVLSEAPYFMRRGSNFDG